MTRELFVSSTPHETKVGLVEDDQLAEVYLERENEYTLAGSIYKGRVTRVLPGMQSAFVDIGLERDAFLYVSDFMELANQDEDLDDIPAPPARAESRGQEAQTAVPSLVLPTETTTLSQAAEEAPPSAAPPTGLDSREERGNWRGRRRRRGRRDRGPNGHDRSSRSREPESRPERENYGPPPGYQPILLPGESISKYRDRAAPTSEEGAPARRSELEVKFPRAEEETSTEDEPLFAEPGHETEQTEGVPPLFEQVESAQVLEGSFETDAVGSPAWDQEQKRLHEMNVAAVFGHEQAIEREVEPEDVASPAPKLAREESSRMAGTLEEEEIDEEEADLASYVEELEEDSTFEELEEETHAAVGFEERALLPQLDSSREQASVVEFAGEAAREQVIEAEPGEEEEDAAADEEAELEQAQAEAEALVDSGIHANSGADVRAEVRAPSGTVGYTQPAYRQGFDRGRGPRRRGRRFRRQEPQSLPLITDLLKEGQEILVQIAKEPIGKKGARITSHIALPGRFLVYMPTVNHTGVSRKIASEEERQRLKRIIQSERENGHGGFIVRTAAQGADEQELRADIRFLKGLWNEIRTRAENSKPPALIYHDLNVVERVLRDQVTSDFSAIWVDNEQEYERILRFANRFQPSLVRRVKLYTKETPLFEQFGLREEIDKALKSKVWLKSGGYIVINQTEALVAIDVNTGKYVGKTTRLEDTIVKTNVDAIREIVRQIRLRDLGGIIVIDFIDMDERRNRQKVMQALEEALRSDRSPSKVLQFNDFGLVAITRKRVKQSLERTIGAPCPYCEATGFVKNVHTVCNEIYVEMRKLAKQLDHSDVMLRVNPEVAKALKTNGGRWLNELEELAKKTIIVKSDPSLHQEQFDIH
ncbi:MAG: Rne/Rng family ribonuclease [Acidobacteria bacterium]|nr:Rne/Rng family ribonuclease [Acidobacteriota bacterium]